MPLAPAGPRPTSDPPAPVGRLPPGGLRACGRRAVRDVEHLLEGVEVGGTEDDAVTGGDVDEVEVDAGAGDLAGEVGELAGTVVDVDHDHLALAADPQVGDRQRVLR